VRRLAAPTPGRSPMKAAALIAGVLAALAGCSGLVDTGEDEGGGGEGKARFTSNVQPMLRASCVGCHEGAGQGPSFLGSPGGDDDYTQVMSSARIVGDFDPTKALLLTKGSHSGITWWNADQSAKISGWLEVEAHDFGESGSVDVLAQWAGCMTLENWNESRMYEWANKQTDQNSTCGGCHGDGEAAFYANPTRETMFAQQRTATGITSFFQISAAGKEPEVVPAFAKLRSKVSGANLHPGAAVDDEYVEYLDRFYHLTRAMLYAGVCESPGYKTPGP
jgi:mono/diheme cytochrome c family protein